MYDRILIATDGSAKSRVAVEHGIELAKSVGAGVLGVYVVNEVVVASAVRQLGADKKEIEEKLQTQGEKALAEIKKMGGEIHVHSQVNKGTTFTVRLPLPKKDED